MKHTPGPWTQWADTNIIICLHSGSKRSENLRICEVATHTWQDQGRYNARLIASAPELLDALKAVQAFIEGKPDAVEPFGMVRAAIAKAEGK
jgi:hypothetical protein